jgi:ribosome-associated heat shock protein Hsp15
MQAESSALSDVRIDKWLWAARFFKTRSQATQAIELGRVRVEGERVKPARHVRIGERIDITMAETRIEVIVRALSTVRGPATLARQLYEETSASSARRARLADVRRYGAEPAQTIKGRPTKREGRLLRRLRGDT